MEKQEFYRHSPFQPSQGVAIFDHQGDMVYANQAFETLYDSFKPSTRNNFLRKLRKSHFFLQKSDKPFINEGIRVLHNQEKVDFAICLVDRAQAEKSHLLVLGKNANPSTAHPLFSSDGAAVSDGKRRKPGSQRNVSIFPDLVGEDPIFQNILLIVQKAAKTDYPVLITGESGTGKEIIARTIHKTSSRRKRRFVDINCAAIPEQLIDSELFGYEKGSFTGALSNGRHGLFYEAHQGSLFLDEIADASSQTQAKLLRILDEGYFKRIGGRRNIKVDVRIISATNRKLSQLVRDGRFRQDLMYRLNTISIHIPPLRERLTDIPLLANYFLKEHARKQNRKFTLSPACQRILQSYDWPGNVRELKGVIDYAVTMATGSTITEDFFPDFLLSRRTMDYKQTGSIQFLELKDQERSLPSVLQQVEEQIIRRALRKARNKSEAIKILGISRRTFYAKIKQYGLD